MKRTKIKGRSKILGKIGKTSPGSTKVDDRADLYSSAEEDSPNEYLSLEEDCYPTSPKKTKGNDNLPSKRAKREECVDNNDSEVNDDDGFRETISKTPEDEAEFLTNVEAPLEEEEEEELKLLVQTVLGGTTSTSTKEQLISKLMGRNKYFYSELHTTNKPSLNSSSATNNRVSDSTQVLGNLVVCIIKKNFFQSNSPCIHLR